MKRIIAAFTLALCLWWPAHAGWNGSPEEGGFRNPPVSGGAGPSYALVRKNQNNTFPSGTSVAVTLTGTAAGHLIVVGTGWCGDSSCGSVVGSVSTVTSSAGETCSHYPNTQGSSGNGQFTDIWYCPNIVGGNDTITVNYATTVFYPFVALSEWSGSSSPSSPADAIGNNGGSGATTAISIATNGSTAVSGELIYSVLAGGGSSVTAGNTSLNTVTTPDNWGQVDEYQIAGAAGTYTNTWTQGSGKAAYSIAAFR